MEIKPKQQSGDASPPESSETINFYSDEIRGFDLKAVLPCETEPKVSPRIAIQIVVVRKPQ